MNDNVRAAIMVVLGMTLISSNDVILKLNRDAFHVGQILFVRGAMAVVLFAMMIRVLGKPVLVPQMLEPRCVGRALCECLATFCFVFSLGVLPIATVTTLAWTAPIFLTIASVLFLKEHLLEGSTP